MEFFKMFLLCLAQTMLYTLAVPVVCGLAVELCYKVCFALMGPRVGHTFWQVTSLIGTPLHECGHALMCFLFGHRITRVRLFHSKEGNAMVEHSFNPKNPYEVFGNLWISIGPIILGLGVIVGLLALGYPESLRSYGDVLGGVLNGGTVGESIRTFLMGLVTEQARPVWVRILCVIGMFSMALHVRLSGADMHGVLRGLPMFAVLAALVSLVITVIGGKTIELYAAGLQKTALLIVSLFGLILLFALAQLLLALVYRLLYVIFVRR